MIDHLQTLYKSVTDQLKDMRKRANWNKTEMKHIMLMIILSDLIEWSNAITKADPKWYKIREKYMMEHPEFSIVRTLTPYHDKLYTNVNTPQSDEFWDRVWDHYDAILTKKVDSPKDPENIDYLLVNTPDGWVQIPIENLKSVLKRNITGVQTDIQFIIPEGYILVSAINGSMEQDSLLDDITITNMSDGTIIHTFDFAAPLDEPIILTFSHE